MPTKHHRTGVQFVVMAQAGKAHEPATNCPPEKVVHATAEAIVTASLYMKCKAIPGCVLARRAVAVNSSAAYCALLDPGRRRLNTLPWRGQ